MVDIITEGTYEECRARVATVETSMLPALASIVDHDNARRAATDEIAAREARTVRPLDITLDLGPTDYGTLASPQGLFRGRPVLLLRVNGRSYNVLYSDDKPTGEGMPAGRPHASLIGVPTVIATRGNGAPAPIVHDVQVGDLVVIAGHPLIVTWRNRRGYAPPLCGLCLMPTRDEQ